MVEIARRLWDRGLSGACEGNLSVRIDPHRVLCTPTGQSMDCLTPDCLVVVDGKKRWASGGEPTSEINMHLAAFAAREDVHAIVHAHPPIATGFTLAGETIPQGVLTEADMVLGKVALVPYAVPTTEDVPRRMSPYFASHDVFLLSHHGAVAFGDDLAEAYNRMETLERCAQMILTARTLGRVSTLPSAELVDVRKAASE